MTHHEIAQLAKRLRYWSLRMTTHAGSGHATSALSAAELMATLMAHHLVYDVKHAENLHNDRNIFSKGHASPLFYAMFEALGVLDASDLLKYRVFDSELEGHPTPRFKHALVATGSLGMGLGFGAGMAEGLRRHGSVGRVWVLLGDGELAEGSVWEAAAFASQRSLLNLTAVVDANRLGQTGPTAYEHHLDIYQKRFEAFGWQTMLINGHDIDEIDSAFAKVKTATRPVVILAKTIKGKGVSFLEDASGWHGKALNNQEFDRAVGELGALESNKPIKIEAPKSRLIAPNIKISDELSPSNDQTVSMRQAVGDALKNFAQTNPAILVLDGDVANSTFTELVRDQAPDQFIECFIAEQLMIEAAVGLSAVAWRPIVSTFAAFLTRAYDQIRMAAYSRSQFMLIGTHVGVSIGQDGPSQMGLEDMAMMRSIFGSMVLSPSDAVSAVGLLSQVLEYNGISYLRVLRQVVPVIYKEGDQFSVGGATVLKSSAKDVACVVATGACVHEALKAYDLLNNDGVIIRVIDAYSIKPINRDVLHAAALECGHFVVVEDHGYFGGLGDAVAEAFSDFAGIIPHITRLAIKDVPRSGKPQDLMEHFGISAGAIYEAVKDQLSNSSTPLTT